MAAANPIWTIARAKAVLDDLDTDLVNGYLRIYDGTIPDRPEAGIGASNLLAEAQASGAMFDPATGVAGTDLEATMTLAAALTDSSANASGTAAYYRLYASDGTTCHWQDTIDTAGGGINLDSTTITALTQVQVSALTLTWPTGE